MRKRISTITFVAAYCAIIVIAAIFPSENELFMSSPSPILPRNADVIHVSIEHLGPVGLMSSSTSYHFDATTGADEIGEILRRYYSVRDFRSGNRPFSIVDVVYTMSIMLDDFTTMTITLGIDSYHYAHDNNKRWNTIIAPEALIAELDVLLNK